MTRIINDFRGDHAFLSNFQMGTPVVFGAVTYPSVEHAYQAAKTLDAEERERIRAAPTPGAAKRLGRRVTISDDWEAVKLDIMLDLLRQKFAIPAMRAKLEGTGDAELIEGNWWGDTFWGVCRGVGENHLGKLLMQVREENRQ